MTTAPQPEDERRCRTQLLPIRDKTVPYGDDQTILEAFCTDGYCVVTGILTPKEVEAALHELWTSERLLGQFDRADPSSWARPDWPQQQGGGGGRNFLASSNVFLDAASWDLASNERLLRVQRLLFGRHDLRVAGLGRWGVMRPARDHPEWRTESSWLHWDQNCWREPDFLRVQAIVCLTDNTATSGGFACVPGFHRRYREWGERHPQGTVVVNGKVIDEKYGSGQPFPLPSDDPCQREVVRVVAPAGSAVLWDSRLPHQNFPNTDATAFRVVHYTMMDVRDDESVRELQKLLKQKRILMDLLNEEGPRFPHKLSPTGRFVHCLEDEPVSLEEALREFGVDNVDGLREAAKLVREAGALEEQGETAAAIQRHRRSVRLFPEIEEWHNAIFG